MTRKCLGCRKTATTMICSSCEADIEELKLIYPHGGWLALWWAGVKRKRRAT